MTEVQAILVKKAREKLILSSQLVRQGYLEDAISRTYYAMFYLAVACLEGEGLRFSSHAAVHGEYGRLFAKTGRLPSDLHRAEEFLRAVEEFLRQPGPADAAAG
ncbi:MAG: HEPN domain-containing protein [Acidobacteriota bacterium]